LFFFDKSLKCIENLEAINYQDFSNFFNLPVGRQVCAPKKIRVNPRLRSIRVNPRSIKPLRNLCLLRALCGKASKAQRQKIELYFYVV
jgi:hypothetical protein